MLPSGQYVRVMDEGETADFRSRSFSDVDASGQAVEHAAYLDRVARMMEEQRRS
jgi:hypothetical protein